MRQKMFNDLEEMKNSLIERVCNDNITKIKFRKVKNYGLFGRPKKWFLNIVGNKYNATLTNIGNSVCNKFKKISIVRYLVIALVVILIGSFALYTFCESFCNFVSFIIEIIKFTWNHIYYIFSILGIIAIAIAIVIKLFSKMKNKKQLDGMMDGMMVINKKRIYVNENYYRSTNKMNEEEVKVSIEKSINKKVKISVEKSINKKVKVSIEKSVEEKVKVSVEKSVEEKVKIMVGIFTDEEYDDNWDLIECLEDFFKKQK